MKRRMADRRARPRFEVVGSLWGTLSTRVALVMRNVSYGGILVDSEVPLELNSEHHVTISYEGAQTPTKVRVRHVSKSGAGPSAYVIGLEFVSVSPTLMSHIENWMRASNPTVES